MLPWAVRALAQTYMHGSCMQMPASLQASTCMQLACKLSCICFYKSNPTVYRGLLPQDVQTYLTVWPANALLCPTPQSKCLCDRLFRYYNRQMRLIKYCTQPLQSSNQMNTLNADSCDQLYIEKSTHRRQQQTDPTAPRTQPPQARWLVRYNGMTYWAGDGTTRVCMYAFLEAPSLW